MQILKIRVKNMNCVGCISTIESHLKKIGGVTDVSLELTTKTAIVAYNGDQTIKRLILSSLKGLGYPSEIID